MSFSIFPAARIGSCAGCLTYPVVLFSVNFENTRYRCATCYEIDVGHPPFPPNSRVEGSPARDVAADPPQCAAQRPASADNAGGILTDEQRDNIVKLLKNRVASATRFIHAVNKKDAPAAYAHARKDLRLCKEALIILGEL